MPKGGELLKTIKRYVDKYTKEIVEVGTELKNVPPERLKELVEAGVVEPPKRTTKKNTEK